MTLFTAVFRSNTQLVIDHTRQRKFTVALLKMPYQYTGTLIEKIYSWSSQNATSIRWYPD